MKKQNAFESHSVIGPSDSLTFYDLLPYSYSAAVRFFTNNHKALKNLILNIWYTDQAERKTVHWKNMDPGIAISLAPEIKKLYPLASSKNMGVRFLQSLKRNLGATLQRGANALNYTYLMYGKVLKHTAIALGILGGFLYMIRESSRETPVITGRGTHMVIRNYTDKSITITPEFFQNGEIRWGNQ